jgi:hypothetical protein
MSKKVKRKGLIYVVTEPAVFIFILLYNIMPYIDSRVETHTFYFQALNVLFGPNGWIVNYLFSSSHQLLSFILMGTPLYIYLEATILVLGFLVLQFLRQRGFQETSAGTCVRAQIAIYLSYTYCNPFLLLLSDLTNLMLQQRPASN